MGRNGIAVCTGVLLCIAAAACGDEVTPDQQGQSCAPGSTAICACPGGVTATQTCEPSGIYSVCPCPGTGFGTAGTTSVGTAGSWAPPPPGGAGTWGAAGDGAAGFFGGAGDGGGTAGVGFAGWGGGAGDGSGAAGDGGGAGSGGDDIPPPDPNGPTPKIPSVSTACPTLASGTIKVLGQDVRLWVGNKQPGKKGPLFFYWHGTGSTANEAVNGLGSALTEIQAEGGMVASFTTSTKTGTNTGNGVWYTGDFEMVDILVKCAVEQLDIDTRRIYTGGCSAGGLQAGAMVYRRSSYLAGAMPNSGGVITTSQFEDASRPAVITAHGAAGKDVVVVDFSTTSARLNNDISKKGSFVVNCDHGGGHCASPSNLKTAQWTFLKAHPFGTKPSP